LLSAATASAHGLIRTADPPDGATLTESPPQVVLTFNEPVHPTLSSAKVLDQAGAKQSIAHSVSPDGRTITVSLPPLPKGTYTIRWRVLSQVDGHTTTGRLSFRITEPEIAAPTAPATPPVQGVGEPEAAAPAPSPAPSPVQVAFRWLGYIAVTLLAGVVFFRRFAFQPSAAIAGVTDAEARFARLGTFAAAAVIAAALAEFAVIGMRTFRVHRLLMVAQGHYMTSRIADFNAPLRVEAPE
jgi:methionine-rich copper-binding protein CopC